MSVATAEANAAARVAPHVPIRPLRNRELDGIRGWAAIAVIAQHLAATSSWRFPVVTELPYFLRDGDSALLVFFILSGDALSAKFLATHDLDVVRKLALTRYFRLGGMIVVSCARRLSLMTFGLAPHREAAAAVNHTRLVCDLLDFPADARGSAWYALIGVYTASQLDPC